MQIHGEHVHVTYIIYLLTLLCENETSHFITFIILDELHVSHHAVGNILRVHRKQIDSHKVCPECSPLA